MRLINYIIESDNNLEVFIKKPSECTPEERKRFLDLVNSGGQNVASYVKASFKKLVWVGFLYVGEEIKAVTSIKTGRNEMIFDAADAEEDFNDYPYEIGFSYTSEDSRGLGYNTILKKAIFKKVGNKGIYATIRVNNTASAIVNQRLGFRKAGVPYEGVDVPVQLWVLDK
jgi:RimJ/RimL family protein N-acetyltransferase